MIKIDILLPYWGDFRLLKKTVDSVLAQTSKDWRLMIFDDHYPSTEASDYYKMLNDPRITYHRHKKNIGITNNFNYALNIASSPYLIMLGSDDILMPNYVDTMLNNIGDADFYQPNINIIDKNDRVYLPLGDRIKKILRPSKQGIYKGEKLANSLCYGNWLYFPSITWKTDVIKRYNFDETYKIVEDVVLELNIIKDGGKLFLDNTTSFQYRRFTESLSSKEKVKGGIRFNEEAEVYKSFSKIFKSIGWNKAAFLAKLRITSRIHSLIS